MNLMTGRQRKMQDPDSMKHNIGKAGVESMVFQKRPQFDLANLHSKLNG